jgi:hypothetical protein
MPLSILLGSPGFGDFIPVLPLIIGEEHIGGDTGDKHDVLRSPPVVLNGPEGTTLACDGGDEHVGGGDDDQLLSIELNSRMLSSGRNSTAKQKARYVSKRKHPKDEHLQSLRKNSSIFARNRVLTKTYQSSRCRAERIISLHNVGLFA